MEWGAEPAMSDMEALMWRSEASPRLRSGEHHGQRGEADVLADHPEQRADALLVDDLRLTRWLRCRYGIDAKNVIGHSESLFSPYHKENVERLRTQTHGDWTHSSMRRYRQRLVA